MAEPDVKIETLCYYVTYKYEPDGTQVSFSFHSSELHQKGVSDQTRYVPNV